MTDRCAHCGEPWGAVAKDWPGHPHSPVTQVPSIPDPPAPVWLCPRHHGEFYAPGRCSRTVGTFSTRICNEPLVEYVPRSQPDADEAVPHRNPAGDLACPRCDSDTCPGRDTDGRDCTCHIGANHDEQALADALRRHGVIPGRNPDGVNDDVAKLILLADDYRAALAQRDADAAHPPTCSCADCGVRARWESDLRERLLSDEAVEAAEQAHWNAERGKHMMRAALRAAVDHATRVAP